MGILTNNTIAFGLGDTLNNVYANISNILYLVDTQSWQAKISYYLTQKARDQDRIYTYYRSIAIQSASGGNFVYNPKPDYFSEKQWEYICSCCNRKINTIYSFTFGINNGIAKPESFDSGDIKKEIYKHFIEQCEPGSISVLDDTDIETLIKEDLEANVPN